METAATIPDPSKQPQFRQSTQEKYTAFRLLTIQGLNPEKAAEMLGYSAQTGRLIAKKLKAQDRGIEGLEAFTSAKRVGKAAKVIDNCMAGKTWGTIDKIKDNTALAAAEIVLDRAYPKQGSGDSGGDVSFTVVNYNIPAAVPADPGPSIDITPSFQEDTKGDSRLILDSESK